MAEFRTKPYLQNPATDAITITWFTDSAESGTLNVSGRSFDSTPVLATALEYQTSELMSLVGSDRPSLPYKHSIRVTGLTPKTSYTYSVDIGQDNFSAEFVTAPGSTETVRFAVYADSETEPESSINKRTWGETSAERPDWIEKDANGRDLYLVNQTDGYRENLRAIANFAPDLVLIAGDLVESGGEQRDWDEFWRHNAGGVTVQDKLNGEYVETGIASSVPILPALGNHENYGGPRDLGGYNGTISVAGIGDVSATNFATDKYLEYFEVPSNGSVDDPSTVEDEAKHDGRYYRLDYGKVTFITLDSSDGEGDQSEQDTNFHIEPDANAPDFNPGSRQFQWAQEQLADAQAQGQTVFVQFHHSPYSVGPHGVIAGQGDNQSGVPLRVYSPLFEQYGVTAVFSGHDELYEHSLVNGVHYYDIGIGGDGLRAPIALENSNQIFLAHDDAPESWEDTDNDGFVDTLAEGGKHYGHLQVEVSFHSDGSLKNATFTPVYILPKTDASGAVVSFEEKAYSDSLTIENPISNNMSINFDTDPNILSTTADGVLFISTADIDGDGDLDILYAARSKSESGWYENLGNGVISTTPNIISTESELVITVEAADLDRDGDLDIVTASLRDDTIAWHKNLGGGNFEPRNIISTAADTATSVTTADLDGDGDLDIISGSFGTRNIVSGQFLDGEVTWYENLGNSSFSDGNVIALADGLRVVETADIDGDGDFDILSASFYDDKIAWYENLGDGSFGKQSIIATGSGAFAIITADIDNDGKLDAVYAFRNDDTIAWSKNLGNGSFGPQNIISTTADEAFSLKTADIDLDGDLDLFAASFADDTFAWYENLGDGSFGTENIISTTADGAAWMSVADLDDDGDLDLVTASYEADTIAWYENRAYDASDLSITPPPGFKVTEFATGLDYPNGMIALEDGSLLVGTSEANAAGYFFSTPGQLLLLPDADQNGVADQQIIVASDLPATITHIKQANDLILVSSYSEFKARSEISVFRRSGIPGDASNPFLLDLLGKIDFSFNDSGHAIVAPVLQETASGQYDLFFSLGAEGNNIASTRLVVLSSSIDDFNIAETELNADSIYKISIDDTGETLIFSGTEQIASGLRNAADFAFEENSGDLYFIENGIDGILTEELSAEGGIADINEPLTADELNRISAGDIGGVLENFGFANEGVKYRTGELINGQGDEVLNSPNYTDPIAIFQPIDGSESEGPASFIFSPSAFPDRWNDGVFIGFYGRGGTAGLANEENPVLFYDFETQSYSQFISNDEPGIGHPITLEATDDALFISDLSSNGVLGGPQGLGQGKIYKIEPNGLPPGSAPTLLPGMRLSQNIYSQGEILELEHLNPSFSGSGWVIDEDGAKDIALIDFKVRNLTTNVVIDVADIPAPAISQHGRWGNFEYKRQLNDLNGGDYELVAVARDQYGNESLPWRDTFTVNSAPTLLEGMRLSSETYMVGASLNFVNLNPAFSNPGWVIDEDGAADVALIDFKVIDTATGVVNDVADITAADITSYGRWGNFDYNLALSSLGVGQYELTAVASDQLGAQSHTWRDSFTIVEVP